MNAAIRIFPAQEMDDLDMAELMDAALLRNGVLQGCSLSLNETTHEVEITSGRMVIKGRLAVVTAGTLERPTDIAVKDTVCYITASCNLADENPFKIQMLKDSEHSELVDLAGHFTESSFNVNNGVWIHEMATVKIDPAVGVTSLTQIATDQRSGKNYAALSASVQKDLNSQIALEKQHWEKHELWRQQIARRWHKTSNFATYTNVADGVNLPANTSGIFVMRKEHGAITRVIDESSGGSTPSEAKAHVDLSKQYGYNGSTGGAHPGILASQPKNPPDAWPEQYDGTYNIPTTVNHEKVHMGIAGVRIDNASTKGTGAANCVLQGFYTEGMLVVAKVRNTGSAAAVLKISITSWYIENPDF